MDKAGAKYEEKGDVVASDPLGNTVRFSNKELILSDHAFSSQQEYLDYKTKEITDALKKLKPQESTDELPAAEKAKRRRSQS